MNRFSALVAASLALAGCTDLLRSHAPAQLVYTPSLVAAPALIPTLQSVLVIARPEPGPGLDTDSISVSLPDHRQDVLAGARWSASVPELVQSYLVSSFAAREGWRAVVSDRSAFGGAYLLQTEVRTFSAQYPRAGAPPVVRVWLHGELGRVRERDLIASIDAVGEAPAAEDRQSAVVGAFEAALAAAAGDLAEKAHEACARTDAPATARAGP